MAKKAKKAAKAGAEEGSQGEGPGRVGPRGGRRREGAHAIQANLHVDRGWRAVAELGPPSR